MVRVIIPARAGSKGLKTKNIARLLEKPLIHYSIEAGREISDEIYVSTDSEEIAQVSIGLGARVIKRPPELASDNATTESVLEHAAEFLGMDDEEVVCYLSACDPVRQRGALGKLLAKLQSIDDYDTLFYARETHRHYWQKCDTKIEMVSEWMKSYKPRQSMGAESMIRECTGYGLITKARYWRDGRRFGGCVGYINICESIPEIDIHSMLDLKLAETALEYLQWVVIR